MAETDKNTNTDMKLILSVMIFGLLFFSSKKDARGSDCATLSADEIAACNALGGENAANCIKEKLSANAATCRNLIDLKNQQKNTLQGQLVQIDQDQQRNQIEYQVALKKSADLSDQIDSLEKQIAEQEKTIEYDKTMLSGLMQAYYDYYQQGILGIVLLNKDFSDVLNQNDYLEQSSVRVGDILSSVTDAKNKLSSAENDLKQKKEESDQLKTDLADKALYIQANQYQKQVLLTQTQGDEAKYQQLLAQVEQQRKELFDFSSAGNLSDVENSISTYATPGQEYFTSGAYWYFSQRDPRWSDMRIGITRDSMSNWGCAITSVAMVYKFRGKNYTPMSILTSANFTLEGDISWPREWYNSGHVNYIDKSLIDDQLKKGNVVIAHIARLNDDGKPNGGHYVVIFAYDKKFGDYVVNDPYFGFTGSDYRPLYLSTSMSLVGKLGVPSKTIIDQIIYAP